LAEATPAVAIAALRRALQTPGILIDSSHVAEDLANLRSAYPDDVAFAAAVMAIAGAIQMARVQRERFGTRLEHRLQNYYSAKFQSDRKPKAPSDLRLVFRPVPETNELEIITFGHRFDPQSVYLTSGTRLKT
jgi:aspartate carbamoyltransferase catalytic subunit